jgi:hypothetical protein
MIVTHVCLCGVEEGQPHAATCPRPLYEYTGDQWREWDAERLKKFGPLAFPCRECSVPAGAKCQNYKGQGKQACKSRGPHFGEAEPEPAGPVQGDLFGG